MVARGEKLKMVERAQLRTDLPEFNVGDTIKMKVRVQEADKLRSHPWEGIVIAKNGKGVRGTFTVRKMSYGEGVEKTFPLHSPVVESITVAAKGEVRRSKLFYLRERTGKKARVKSSVVK